MSHPYKLAANRRPSPPVGLTLHVVLRRVNRLVVVIEKTAVAALLVAVILFTFQQVVMRYLFLKSIPWSEEISRFCFIWLSMLGASLAMEKNSHFVFEELVKLLNPTFYQRFCFVVKVLVAAMLFSIMLLGIGLAILIRAERSAALNIPISWVYTALPVAAGLMLLHLIVRIRRSPEDMH